MSVTSAFEVDRPRLWSIAYRMTGRVHDAEDVLQAAWLKADAAERSSTPIASPTGWLSTVVSREAIDVLRRRQRRAEVSLDAGDTPVESVDGPETDYIHVESVGRALLVVLNRLTPEQRAAYVLHDMFDVPFATIADLLTVSTAAAKQLASRARRRVAPPNTLEHGADRSMVEAYLAASRDGDIEGLLAVLAPDVVRTSEPTLVPDGHQMIRGARSVAEQTRLFADRAQVSAIALIDGRPAVIVAPHGRLRAAMLFTIDAGRIAAIRVVGSATLDDSEIAPVEGPPGLSSDRTTQ
ncbi:sigma-70 family RNA polymerase sigma factor [Gordonia soli]|nr:sigma-70 family RNA polymerase sigma factor [Gordonia soli]